MTESDGYLKVSEAFLLYLGLCRNTNMDRSNIIQLFDCMTTYIRSSNTIDSNFDLLYQLNSVSNNNDSNNNDSKEKQFNLFFELYADYLDAKELSQEIISIINKVITQLVPDTKTSILNFIWSLPGFRRHLVKFKTTDLENNELKGIDYLNNSIFTPMMSDHKSSDYVDNTISANAYDSLVSEMSQEEFNSVFQYLVKIIKANKAYTYDNPSNYRGQLASFELLGTILILFCKLIKNNTDHVFESDFKIKNKPTLLQNIWDVINILYFTVFEIKRCTTNSCKYYNDEYTNLNNEFKQDNCSSVILINQINEIKKNIEDGEKSLDRIFNIIFKIDNKLIESIIFENIYFIVSSLQTSILYRFKHFLLERKVCPDTRLSKNICYTVNLILKSKVPPQVKLDFLRYIMSYSLSTEYIKLGKPLNSTENTHMNVLAEYCLTDARKLEDITLIHSLDILDHFGTHLYEDKQLIKSNKIISLYLGYLEGANELYEKIINHFINCNDSMKPMIINDMKTLVGYASNLICIINTIGHEALEYIDPLMNLLDKIINTKELLNIPFDDNLNELGIINHIKDTTIKKFKPLVIELFKNLNSKVLFYGEINNSDNSDNLDIWKQIYSMFHIKDNYSFSESVFRLVLKENTINILHKLFNINLQDLEIPYVVYNSNIVNNLDAITCDYLVSPVAIPTSANNDSIVIINRNTMHKILLDGINPYTRQELSYEDILSINSKPDIIDQLNETFNGIRKL
jgi:hypothetical protein